MTKKRLTRKSLAAIVGITLVSAGAAAAGGVVSTPFSAQRPSVAKSMHFASDDSTEETDADVTTTATNKVESDDATEVAKADDSADDAADDATDGTGQGPDVNGPAKFGLCTAYAARTKHDEVTTTTAAATPPAEPVTVDSLPVPFQNLTDAADAAGQTVAEFCADATPGGSGDNPSVTAPGKSGDNPSETAPGKSDDNPSITAPGKSDVSSSAKGHGKAGAGHGHSSTTLAGS